MKVFRAILIILGGGLIFNSLISLILVNFNLGIVLFFLIGASLLVLGAWLKQIRRLTDSGVLRIVKYLFYLGTFFIAGTILFIAVFGQTDYADFDEDVLIVLGAGIRGEQLTLALKYRLDKALEYHHQNKDAIIVVSGGQGKQESITEALAMQRYLLANGVLEEVIIKEEKATSTYENFVKSKQILDEIFIEEYRTAFVTNGFHVYRATLVSKAAGIEAKGISAKLKWYDMPQNYLRECLAVIKVWVFGK